jgi:DNA-binding PadR family transcriptional regulator
MAQVKDLLPLTPIAFEILLALGDGEKHGYGIMRDVAARTGGETTLHPGTLYRAVGRLVDAGLLRELEERPAPDFDDGRRRAYYRLTELGTQVAIAEAERLQSQVGAARLKHFLPDSQTV